MSVSFLGLNSSFDSASLVQQLVDLETQSRIVPLEQKKVGIQNEQSFMATVEAELDSLKSLLNVDSISNGSVEPISKQVTSSDTSNEFTTITATDDAVSQTFDLNISQLATQTSIETSSSIVKSYSAANALSTYTFKAGASETSLDGTLTINGETQTFSNSGGNMGDVETFLNSFSGVSASYNSSTGQMELSGITTLGSSGDTSNILSAFGLDNATISGGNVSGIQNTLAAESSSLLTDIGVTGTTLTVNGTDISYDPLTDTVQNLLDRINNTSETKVVASFDPINGLAKLTNDDTGALSITISSDGTMPLFDTVTENLGQNAEFTISNFNGGSTIVSNSNSVTDLVEGLTIDLNKVTTSPVSVTVAEDPDSLKTTVEDILNKTNTLINFLSNDDTSFSRGLINQIRNTFGTSFSGNPFNSLFDIGIQSSLSALDNSFTGYEFNASVGSVTLKTFDEAFLENQDAVLSLLFGDSTGEVNALSGGESGIFVQLDELIANYTDTDGVIDGVEESLSGQIDSVDSSLEREQNSIDSLENRLKAQFAQLDIISAQYQQQQSAVNSLLASIGTTG